MAQGQETLSRNYYDARVQPVAVFRPERTKGIPARLRPDLFPPFSPGCTRFINRELSLHSRPVDPGELLCCRTHVQ